MDTHASMTNLPDSAEAGAHTPGGEEHVHPTWSTYWKVALILTLITVGEVWAYYIPSFVAGRGFVPTLLALSALKFAIVVMFYMHLKYDHKLFRVLFTGPLFIAALTLLALLFLFGHLFINVGPRVAG
jgi:cytochrome c oxidase subunit IV